MLRISPNQKSQIERNYPKNKRLSKEQVAKYYVAWGTSPFLVRKGGEKVFRDFMNFVQLDHREKPISPENLGRAFYEDMIAKAILFKEFEQLYGSGPNAIGQIRSSVVPYALSLLYRMTLVKKLNHFDLGAIWVLQRLPDDLKEFSKSMLRTVHEWLKMYSKSDDVGEYAKKEELWNDIIKSPEFAAFENTPGTKEIILKYKLSESDFKKRYQASELFDFSHINENCRIHSNGFGFYTALKLHFYNSFTPMEMQKLEEIIQRIQGKQYLLPEMVQFEEKIIKKLQIKDPDWFLESKIENKTLINTAGLIATIYNKNLTRVKEAFEFETTKAVKKGISQMIANSYRNIGINIAKNEVPSMADLYKVSEIASI